MVQGVEPCGKKGVAPLKRSRRCWFGIVRPDPHGSQNSQTWLRNSCDRAAPSNRHPCLPTDILAFLLGPQSLEALVRNADASSHSYPDQYASLGLPAARLSDLAGVAIAAAQHAADLANADPWYFC